MTSQRGVTKSGASFPFISRDDSEPSQTSKMGLFAKLDIRYFTPFWICLWLKKLYNRLWHNGLNHFNPVFHFCTPGKVFWRFQGVQKWNIELKWIKTITGCKTWLLRTPREGNAQHYLFHFFQLNYNQSTFWRNVM